MSRTLSAPRTWARSSVPHEWLLVVAIGVLLVVGALGVDGFLGQRNLSDAIVGQTPLILLAMAMAVVVIGGGLDLSLVIVSVVSAHVGFELVRAGMPGFAALAIGVALAMVVGVLNGALVVYFELPALFVTIGTGLVVLGVARLTVFGAASYTLPAEAAGVRSLVLGSWGPIPARFVLIAVVAVALHLVLTRTVPGRFLYAQGDNPATARLTGLPTRPLTMGMFAMASALGFVAAAVLALQGQAISHVHASGSLLYDVITVVVIGGVSLAGGRGTVMGVLLGGLFVALLLNVMTLLNLSSNEQILIKGAVLLAALALDAVLHPRSTENHRVGDL